MVRVRETQLDRAICRGRDKEDSSEHLHSKLWEGGQTGCGGQGRAEHRGGIKLSLGTSHGLSTGGLHPCQERAYMEDLPKELPDSEKPPWPVSGLFSRGYIFGTRELLNPEDTRFCSCTYNCVTQKAPMQYLQVRL